MLGAYWFFEKRRYSSSIYYYYCFQIALKEGHLLSILSPAYVHYLDSLSASDLYRTDYVVRN